MPDLSSHSGTQVLFSDVSVNLYFSVDLIPVLKWAACEESFFHGFGEKSWLSDHSNTFSALLRS